MTGEDDLIMGHHPRENHFMTTSYKRILRAWATCLVLVVFAPRFAFGTDNFTLEHYTDGGAIMTELCPSGGTSTVVGSEIGRMTYLPMRFVNNGTVAVTMSTLTIRNLTGCVVPWNPISRSFDINPGGADIRGEVGVRPTAATWSFQLSFTLVGAATVIYTHTFTESGISAGAGPQVEVSFPYPSVTKHTEPTSGSFNDGSGTIVGEYYEVAVRLTNRSAVQDLVFTAPGWTSGNTPFSEWSIENQVPASLGVDQSVITILRRKAIAVGQASSVFQCLTNDETVQVFVLVTAIDGDRLPVFFGARQLSANNAATLVPSTIGVAQTISLTVRNDDTDTLTYTAGLPSVSGCTASTTTAPTTPLTAGLETTWVITVTPTTTQWSFSVPVVISSPFYLRYFTFKNTSEGAAAAPAGSSGDGSSSSKCGVGSGLATLLSMALCGLVVLLPGRRTKRG